MLRPNLFRAGSCRCDHITWINITVLQTADLLFHKLVVCLPCLVLHKSSVCFSALLFCLYSAASMLQFKCELSLLSVPQRTCSLLLIMQKILIYASSNVKITALLPLRAHFCPLTQTAGCSVFNIANTLPAFLSILIKLTRSHFTFIVIILMYNSLLSITLQCMTIIILSAISSITRDFASSSCFV